MKSKIILFITILIILFTPKAYAQTPTPTPQPGILQSIGTGIAGAASFVLTLGNTVSLVSPKSSFGLGQEPIFTLNIPQKTTTNIGTTQVNHWIATDEDILASMVKEGTTTPIDVAIQKIAAGQFTITANDPRVLTSGNYILTVTAKETFLFTRNLTQDFTWGVLAINTNKSIYLPGETAKLSMGVVDDKGRTVCDAKLQLVITDPSNNQKTLTTEDNSITKAADCKPDQFTTEPDYAARYTTNSSGMYHMRITATTKNGSHSLDDFFEARNSVAFDVERVDFPTRMYPFAPYDVKLVIKANQDYAGPVYDSVPKSFGVRNISHNGKADEQDMVASDSATWIKGQYAFAQVVADANSQQINGGPGPKSDALNLINSLSKKPFDPLLAASSSAVLVNKDPGKIVWNMDMKTGQTYTLSYTLDFPQAAPEFYVIGPFTVGDPASTTPIFQEARQWQIAADLQQIVCWTGDGANSNWDTIANWSTSAVPTTSQIAMFGSPTCTAGTDPNKNVTVNVDPTLTSGGGIVINPGYSGTISVSSGVNVRIASTSSVTSTYIQHGGTFTNTNGTFAFGSGSSTNTAATFVLNAGTFTSTSGTFNMQANNVIIGQAATFIHNSGLVDWNSVNCACTGGSAHAWNGSVTFASFRIRGAGNSGATPTYNVNAGTVISVATNFLTSEGNSTGITANGPGIVELTGSATITTGASGPGIAGTLGFRISGSGSQTLSVTQSRFPGGQITINKSGGSFSLSSNYTVNSSQIINVLSGTFNLSGRNITVGTLTVEDGGTLQLQGAETITITTKNFRNGSTVIYTGNGTATATTYTVTTLASTYSNLTINSTDGATDTFQLGANITITGNFTLTAGTFDASNDSGVTSFNMTIGGNFANTGTFTARAGTVTFNTATLVSTISGSTTFNNFTCSTAGKTLVFTAGTTQTIGASGVFTITGAANNPISLTSSTNNSVWTITDSGTESVSYALVRDSTATNGITAATSRDEGGNTNWTFSGSAYSGQSVLIQGGTTINGGVTIQSP